MAKGLFLDISPLPNLLIRAIRGHGSLKISKGEKMMNKKTLLLVICVVVIAVAAAVLIFGGSGTSKGSKNITIEVVDDKGTSVTYEVKTDAEYLQGAMDEADGLTYEAIDSEYGLMIQAVNGIRAVYEENGAYWDFYINGEYCNFGISEQPIADGDEFLIEYTPA